jgi:hypothetical protein
MHQLPSRLLHHRCASRPLLQKWLVHIILQSLKIGVNRDHMLEWLHPDAPAELAKTKNLRLVCSRFARPDAPRSATTLTVGTPFDPMLAYNPKHELGSLVANFRGKPFLMEVSALALTEHCECAALASCVQAAMRALVGTSPANLRRCATTTALVCACVAALTRRQHHRRRRCCIFCRACACAMPARACTDQAGR